MIRSFNEPVSPLQLPEISAGNNILDLVIIGCGPAGLALAAESAKLGLNVGLIGPDLPFTNNYGVWEDEFKGNVTYIWFFSHLFLTFIHAQNAESPNLLKLRNYCHLQLM